MVVESNILALKGLREGRRRGSSKLGVGEIHLGVLLLELLEHLAGRRDEY